MKPAFVTLKPRGLPELRYIGFSGLPEFAAIARACPDPDGPVGWAGSDFDTACTRALSGDLARVAPSDALLDKVESLLDLSGLKTVTVPAVAGGVPCVPAFLAGSPMAMRVRKRRAHDRGEVVLCVEGWTSADADSAAIARRGAAVLALARALSGVRPVRIVSYAASGSDRRAFFYTLPIDSAPIDLARAAWVFSAPEFVRQCRLAIQYYHNNNNTDTQRIQGAARLLPDLLGVDADSCVTVEGLTDSGAFGSDASAVDWIRGHLHNLADMETA